MKAWGSCLCVMRPGFLICKETNLCVFLHTSLFGFVVLIWMLWWCIWFFWEEEVEKVLICRGNVLTGTIPLWCINIPMCVFGHFELFYWWFDSPTACFLPPNFAYSHPRLLCWIETVPFWPIDVSSISPEGVYLEWLNAISVRYLFLFLLYPVILTYLCRFWISPLTFYIFPSDLCLLTWFWWSDLCTRFREKVSFSGINHRPAWSLSVFRLVETIAPPSQTSYELIGRLRSYVEFEILIQNCQKTPSVHCLTHKPNSNRAVHSPLKWFHPFLLPLFLNLSFSSRSTILIQNCQKRKPLRSSPCSFPNSNHAVHPMKMLSLPFPLSLRLTILFALRRPMRSGGRSMPDK